MQKIFNPFAAKGEYFYEDKKTSNSGNLQQNRSVTTQMKALNENFLMEVFTLLLNRVHVFAICNSNMAVRGSKVAAVN